MDSHYQELDIFDTYTYLSIGCCSMVASLMLFVIHVVSKDLRKQPGDLVMMIAFSEFFLSLHWFMSALRTDYVLGGYPDDSLFCKVNSAIAVTAATLGFSDIDLDDDSGYDDDYCLTEDHLTA